MIEFSKYFHTLKKIQSDKEQWLEKFEMNLQKKNEENSCSKKRRDIHIVLAYIRCFRIVIWTPHSKNSSHNVEIDHLPTVLCNSWGWVKKWMCSNSKCSLLISSLFFCKKSNTSLAFPASFWEDQIQWITMGLVLKNCVLHNKTRGITVVFISFFCPTAKKISRGLFVTFYTTG